MERNNHLQLTHFFVDPDVQGGGVGRALLDRALIDGSDAFQYKYDTAAIIDINHYAARSSMKMPQVVSVEF